MKNQQIRKLTSGWSKCLADFYLMKRLNLSDKEAKSLFRVHGLLQHSGFVIAIKYNVMKDKLITVEYVAQLKNYRVGIITDFDGNIKTFVILHDGKRDVYNNINFAYGIFLINWIVRQGWREALQNQHQLDDYCKEIIDIVAG